jgi:hypothetical protein
MPPDNKFRKLHEQKFSHYRPIVKGKLCHFGKLCYKGKFCKFVHCPEWKKNKEKEMSDDDLKDFIAKQILGSD